MGILGMRKRSLKNINSVENIALNVFDKDKAFYS